MPTFYIFSYVKHPFAETAPSHTQITCQLGSGAFTPKKDGGGVYCMAWAIFNIFVVTGGVYSGISRFS